MKRIVKATHQAEASPDAFARFLRGDNSGLRCTRCGAPAGECDCWTPCACGWTFAKGTACNNPDCTAAPRPRVHSMRAGRDAYPADAVRIDRTTKWGNPFFIGRDGSRDDVIRKYEHWLRLRLPGLVAAARRELLGKDLLCWCAPLACHGDVLLEIANEAA